jgi:hypothetical protein
MSQSWVWRDALVAVKAYPNPSAKYGETVCVAVVTREEGWIRLYPVQFRTLPASKRFQKYQRVRLRMTKHRTDPRPESYRPDELSLKLGPTVGTGQAWAGRRAWIEPTLSASLCEIVRLQAQTGKSLGAFRPREVSDLVVEDAPAEWDAKKQAALAQLWLFDEQARPLEKIPHIFKYCYRCQDPRCNGHVQSILDWELMQLYRRLRDAGEPPDRIQSKIRRKFLDEICGSDKDTIFFVGNHSRFPQTFMVLGTFWPPRRAKTLFENTL